MPEKLFINLLGAKRVFQATAWLGLSDDGKYVPLLYGKIRHTKYGPVHEYIFKYTEKGWKKWKK